MGTEAAWRTTVVVIRLVGKTGYAGRQTRREEESEDASEEERGRCVVEPDSAGAGWGDGGEKRS